MKTRLKNQTDSEKKGSEVMKGHYHRLMIRIITEFQNVEIAGWRKRLEHASSLRLTLSGAPITMS